MSEKIEVLITIPLIEELVEELQQVSERYSFNIHPAHQGQEVPIELWEKTAVLYTLYALPEAEQAPNLKWVQFYLAGVDRVIDAPIFQQEDLLATTMSGANTSQTAEHVLTMLLALGHTLPDFLSHQSRNEWMSNKSSRYRPRELRESTIGIVGYGSIGRQIARLLQEFGAEVLATKRKVMRPEDSGYTSDNLGDPQGDFFTRLYPPEALMSMFKECDFVVVTVPLTPETKDMISVEQLTALKPSAYLIDVSRGGVVDHEALIEALIENRLAGAALDVFPEEPLPADNPLWTMSNVILTPHVAGFSENYNQRANALFAENLSRYLEEEPLLNQVNINRGY